MRKRGLQFLEETVTEVSANTNIICVRKVIQKDRTVFLDYARSPLLLSIIANMQEVRCPGIRRFDP